MKNQVMELPPVRDKVSEYEAIEARLRDLFLEEIYEPLIEEVDPTYSFKNAPDDLLQAINKGRIVFSGGKFTGKFSARISKDLKELGAKWTGGSWSIPKGQLPKRIRDAVDASASRFEKVLKKFDEKLSKILPEKIAEKFDASDLFDSTLFRVNRDLKTSLKNLVVAPELTNAERARIAREYTENFRLYIQKWTEKEIKSLRKTVSEKAQKGLRYEDLVKEIQHSYGVSRNHARFLARQETKIFLAKFKATRYQSVGIQEYVWGCVRMPKDRTPTQHTPGNIRYTHGILEGKVFRWDQPPVVNEKGDRKNPGEDYNCRCFAKPVVRYTK